VPEGDRAWIRVGGQIGLQPLVLVAPGLLMVVDRVGVEADEVPAAGIERVVVLGVAFMPQ